MVWFNILKLLKSSASSSGQVFPWQVTEVWLFPKNYLAAASACQEAVRVHLASDKVSWGTQRHRNQHEAFGNGTMSLHGGMALISLC